MVLSLILKSLILEFINNWILMMIGVVKSFSEKNLFLRVTSFDLPIVELLVDTKMSSYPTKRMYANILHNIIIYSIKWKPRLKIILFVYTVFI